MTRVIVLDYEYLKNLPYSEFEPVYSGDTGSTTDNPISEDAEAE